MVKIKKYIDVCNQGKPKVDTFQIPFDTSKMNYTIENDTMILTIILRPSHSELKLHGLDMINDEKEIFRQGYLVFDILKKRNIKR